MKNSTALTPVQIDNLNRLCRMIKSDKTIRKWFHSLESLPSNLRANAIMQITTEMRRNEEEPSLIAAVCCISDTVVYNTAVEAVRELEN
jgi:hypothetical protein